MPRPSTRTTCQHEQPGDCGRRQPELSLVYSRTGKHTRTDCRVDWYLATIFGFAFTYYRLGPGEHIPFSQLGAVVFSVTTFHGHGFFPVRSPGHILTLDDSVAILAATEAIVGLLIEITFIATFTQRFSAQLLKKVRRRPHRRGWHY